MKVAAHVLLLCLGAAILAAPPVAAGPLTGSGYYVLLVLDQNRQILLNLSQGFGFTDRGVLTFEEQSILEAEAILRFDPDPVAAYEFTIRNTTSGSIEGALSLGFDIAPQAGGAPAYTRLEFGYQDTGGDGLDDRILQDAWLTEDVGPGWPTYLTDLALRETVTSETEQLLSAGPVALPDPQKSAQYDEFAVQLSFHLQAGDSAVFRGAATFPDPPPVCGDGRVDPLMGEECDPPDGWSCDETCHPVPEPGWLVLRLSALAALGALTRSRRTSDSR